MDATSSQKFLANFFGYYKFKVICNCKYDEYLSITILCHFTHRPTLFRLVRSPKEIVCVRLVAPEVSCPRVKAVKSGPVVGPVHGIGVDNHGAEVRILGVAVNTDLWTNKQWTITLIKWWKFRNKVGTIILTFVLGKPLRKRCQSTLFVYHSKQ